MSLGEKFGWYKRACLDVSFVNVSYASIMQTLASGTANVAWNTMQGVISTYHLKKDLVYLYPWDIFAQGNALMGRPGIGLETFEDFVKQGKSRKAAISAVIAELKGKTIVTTENNIRDEFVDEALDRQHKPLDWVKKVNLDPASGLAAFLGGTGDAYVAGVPQRQTLVAHHYLTLLAGPNLATPSLNGFLTTRKFWNAHRDAFLALQHVTYMSMRYTAAHKAQVARYIARTYNHDTGSSVTPKDFLDDWQGLEIYPTTAAQAEKLVVGPTSPFYWKTKWDADNRYSHAITHAIPADVPASANLTPIFQKAYVAKYGATEKGWWPVNGKL
jgi:ABC-type nitrate/sulfonate/bicarbonate transport system substrate-binding protein